MSTKWMLGLAAGLALAQTAAQIENDQVRVLVAHQVPHKPTALHQHKVNRVMIYLKSCRERFDFQNGKPETRDFHAGQVDWSPAGGMHVAEIVSPDPVTIVEIEVRKPGNPQVSPTSALDPVKVDPKHYHVEFENDQVRVLRVKIGPHESTPVHRHAVNRVVTYLTDQNFRVTSSDGKVDASRHKAGEVSWGVAGTHKEENLGDKPVEIIATEFKN